MNSEILPNTPDGLFGIGLRKEHYTEILENPEKILVDWFEVISENYMETEGRPILVLEEVRKNYPIAMHGVSLSIGKKEGIDIEYLHHLKTLVDRVEPFIVSDHFCWTGFGGINLHDLYPLPLTKESIQIVTKNLEVTQNYLKRKILLENASSYLAYKSDEMKEWEFINAVTKQSGCGFLFDINNLYVNSQNHGIDPIEYIQNIDPKSVKQFHLAGFTDMGSYLFDTHSANVATEVWELFQIAAERFPNTPVLLEWDADIPEFSLLQNEVMKAKKYL